MLNDLLAVVRLARIAIDNCTNVTDKSIVCPCLPSPWRRHNSALPAQCTAASAQ